MKILFDLKVKALSLLGEVSAADLVKFELDKAKAARIKHKLLAEYHKNTAELADKQIKILSKELESV